MATFEAQVEGLTSLSIDGSSAPTQTELTQFLTDGAKEIINILPENLLPLCSSSVSFTSGSASTLNTGKVLHVFRSDGDINQPCRPISPINKGRYSDPDDMNYATITDPVFYIENNSLDVLPVGGSATYSEVQYPAVAYGDSSINVFPDEAEYLVPIYASIKSLQNVLGSKSSNSNINTALSAIATEMGETQAVCDKIDADLVLAKAEVVLAKTEAAELAIQTDNGGDFETACDAMATELAKVDNIIVEASAEFDKVDNVIVEGSVEFDKSSALLDLGETDSEGAVNTAAAKIITEMDETQAVCDKIDADLVLAKAEIVLAKAEAAELASNTDNSSDFETACDAMVTELNKVDDIIDLANEEFDEVATQTSGSKDSPITDAFTEFEEAKNLSGAYNSGVFKTALDALKASVLNAEDEIEDANKMLANIVLGVAEVTESAVDTDTSSSEFQVAADAINTALDRVASYNWGDSDTFTSGSAQLTRVKDAIDNAGSLINNNLPSATTDAFGAQANEDIELVSSALNIAQTEISRAKTHLEEWNSLLRGATNEAQGFASEVQARGVWTSAKAQVWNGYFESSKLYAQAAQTYLASAQGYSNEIQANATTMQAFISTGKAYLEEAQSTINAGNAYIQEAQARISQANGYAAEVNARAGFSGAKAKAIQGYISTAQTYVSSAQGFGNEVQAKIAIANGYISEINIRLKQAEAKRQESQSRLSAGGAYLQEAQAIIAQGSAYISEAQGYVSQAKGYATEVNARAGFSSAKAQSIQGYVNTAQSYVATAQGFANEIQAKINIAQGYSNEVQARLTVDTSHYGWYEKQQAKLQADYDKGIMILSGRSAA